MSKFEAILKEFKDALKNFEEVMQEERSEVVRDAAIKRFELTFELAWKLIKAFLEEHHNMRCASPQSCFREAFSQGLINYDEMWIKMAEWRNLAVHTYREELAEDLYKKLPEALKRFQLLEKKFGE